VGKQIWLSDSGQLASSFSRRPATHLTRHSEIICLIINEINCFPYTSSAVTEDRVAETFERHSINSATILFYPGAQMAYNRTPLGGGVVVRTGPS